MIGVDPVFLVVLSKLSGTAHGISNSFKCMTGIGNLKSIGSPE